VWEFTKHTSVEGSVQIDDQSVPAYLINE